jgi:hypothetical protein
VFGIGRGFAGNRIGTGAQVELKGTRGACSDAGLSEQQSPAPTLAPSDPSPSPVSTRFLHHHHHATNFTRLLLTSCVKLLARALNALLSVSPVLTRLEMHALPAVTDETCSIVATRCPSITGLDLGRSSNPGPGALPAIWGTNIDGGLRRLRVLHMAGYPHIDPDVFKQLGESLGATLETLDLAGVWGVTDAGLAAYANVEPSAAEVAG